MAKVEEESEGSQREAGITAAEGGQAQGVWRGRERYGEEDGEGAETVGDGAKEYAEEQMFVERVEVCAQRRERKWKGLGRRR